MPEGWWLVMRRVFLVLLLLVLAGCGGAGSGFAVLPHQDVNNGGGNPQTGNETFSLSVLRDTSGVPTGVRVSWQRVAVDTIDGYWIYRATGVGDLPDGNPAGHESNRVSGSIIPQSGSGTDTLTYDDLFTLDVGDTYYYRMSVVNATHDESDFSNQLSITIAEHDITGITTTAVGIGDQVTIDGHHFGASRNGDQVFFSNHSGAVSVEAASYVSWSDTQIVVTVPYGTADGPLGVSLGGTRVDSADPVNYTEPNLTGISPVEDWVQHDDITLTGNDFGSVQSGNGYNSYVYFGATQCQAGDIVSWADGQIVCKVPAAAAASSVNVKVVVALNESGTQSFTVMPHIGSISPTTGATGTSVTITGTSFGATQGSGSVSVNGVSASITSWANTSVVITIPAAALDGNVVVTRSDAKVTNGVGFDVSPTITSISPARRQVGQQLTINGSGFGNSRGSSTVHFNGGNADVSSYVSWANNQIVVVVPASSATGTVSVNISDNSVGSNNDSATSSSSVTVVLAPPNINGVGQI
jgi:hypothetical protein